MHTYQILYCTSHYLTYFTINLTSEKLPYLHNKKSYFPKKHIIQSEGIFSFIFMLCRGYLWLSSLYLNMDNSLICL